MKVKGAGKVHYDSGPNMTPLVDVIMVILIFLMMCGTFSGQTQYLVSSTPVMGPGANQKHYDNTKVPTLVRVNIEFDPRSRQGWMTDRQAAMNPAYIVKFTGDRIGYNTYNGVVSKLASMRSDYTNQGLNADDLQVVLCPSDLVKYQDVVAVYQAALEAKFTKVGFAAAHVEALGGASNEYR
jgi:biopolymer transport protein ExbD